MIASEETSSGAVMMLPKPSLPRCCYSCVILLCTALYITAMLNSVFEEESAVLPSQGLQQSPACRPAVVQPSPHKHVWAHEGLQVSRIAFGSCFVPHLVRGDTLWSQVRLDRPDVWLWLGDNAYSGGTDMNYKRKMYNQAREEPSYLSQGPLKEGAKIPVLATWDDWDSSANDRGNDYPCMKESQNEFVRHFNIPPTEPLHWDFPRGQQEGVYNSRMFVKPGTSEPGLQVILLDGRTGRDPTFPQHGSCQGASSQMLSPAQWRWLEQELARPAEVTVIASGVQVLPPTDQRKPDSDYCSHDSHSGGEDTFREALDAVQEGDGERWPGQKYEEWGEIPQERAKLLGLAQKALNKKTTRAVVFVSGDVHYAELMAKRMPKSTQFGAAQVLYEVTTSGIYENWPGAVGNGNRLRERSCNWAGEGEYNQACVFPFTHQGTSYTSCVPGCPPAYESCPAEGAGWCATRTDSQGHLIQGEWGQCAPPEEELAQTVFSNSSQTCSGSKFHICTAQANYGYLEVDFSHNTLRMGVRTPEEKEEMYHEIRF